LGVQIIGVSFDKPAENKLFQTNNNYEYELWSDLEREVALYYGAASSTSAFFADRITVVVAPDGEWVLTYPSVKPGQHPQDVLNDMTAIIGANAPSG